MKWVTSTWARVRDLWAYRHEPECLRWLADIYWSVLLIALVCTVLFSAVYGGSKLLTALENKNGEGLFPKGGGAMLNRAELQATLDGFAERKAQYELLKKNPPKIPDPSR